jgi:PAS domain S-box-containing protein
LLTGLPLSADDLITLQDNRQAYQIGPHCSYYVDEQRQLDIATISSAARSSMFTPHSAGNINLGFTPAAVWVRFQIDNRNSFMDWFLRIDAYDDIRAYTTDGRGGFSELRLGKKYPASGVLRRYGYFYLKLPPASGVSTVYLRFINEDSMGLRLSIISLAAFLGTDKEDLIYGIYFGLIAVMVVYNLFIFFMLRDPSYVFYSVYILNMFIVQIIYLGLMTTIIPAGSFISIDQLETVVLSLALAFYIQFARFFLIARTNLPRLNRAMLVLAFISLAIAPASFILPYQVRILSLSILFVAALSGIIALIVASVRRRYRPVYFYIAALVAVVAGVTIFLLRSAGALPVIEATDLSMQIGSSAEAVLLAFGLAFRINVLQNEKASALESGRTYLAKAERMESDYRMLFDTAPLGIALFTLDGRYLAVNHSYCLMYERTREELLGQALFTTVYPEARDNAERSYWDALVAGPQTGIATFERSNVTRSGRRITVRYFLNFTRTPAGAPEGVLCCVEDITDLKKALDSLRSSVREKDLLLKEVHHRVKNNLQIIISLFRSKARELDDPRFQSVLETTAGRIKAIANVHNRIYLSRDVSRVDADTFIPSSVKQAMSITHLTEEQCLVVYKIEQAKLSVDIALPLSLILNELITNSVMHGYSGETPLTIEVRFQARPAGDEAKYFHLEIMDTGLGFPENFPTSHFETFGLNLVETLALQLGGTMTLTTDPHTRIAISFGSGTEPI